MKKLIATLLSMTAIFTGFIIAIAAVLLILTSNTSSIRGPLHEQPLSSN